MTIDRLCDAHPALMSLNPRESYTFFELSNRAGPYAAAALAEHADCLELHLEVLRYGPHVVRGLRADVDELKRMARALGKNRIVGLRMEAGVEADLRWPKFTRLFGCTGQRVYQAAELIVD